MDDLIRFANRIPSLTEPIGWTGTPIVQTGVDVVGKSLGWLPPPSVLSSPSAKTLLESSPVALAGGAIGLKTILFTEAGVAFAMAPVASTGFIGLAFLVGLAIGVPLLPRLERLEVHPGSEDRRPLRPADRSHPVSRRTTASHQRAAGLLRRRDGDEENEEGNDWGSPGET